MRKQTTLMTRLRETGFVLALTLSLGTAGASLHVGQAFAQSALQTTVQNNLTFEGPDGGRLVIPTVEFRNTNLTNDEIKKLFDPKIAGEEQLALFRKLKADLILIPEVRREAGPKEKTPQSFEAKGIRIENISEARIRRFQFDGLKLNAGEEMTSSVGTTVAEGLDVNSLFDMIRDKSPLGKTPIRLEKFTNAGMEIKFPEGRGMGPARGSNMMTMTIGRVDAANVYTGDLPTRSYGAMKGMTLVGSPSGQFSKQIKELGYDRLAFDFTFDASLDAAAKTMLVKDFTLIGENMGSFGLGMGLSSIDVKALYGDQAQQLLAFLASSIDRVDLKVSNTGLFQNAMALTAKMSKRTPEAVIGEYKTLAVAMLPLMLGADAGVVKLAGAIGTFMDNPKNLNVTLTGKNGPVKVIELSGLKEPKDALKLITIDANNNP